MGPRRGTPPLTRDQTPSNRSYRFKERCPATASKTKMLFFCLEASHRTLQVV